MPTASVAIRRNFHDLESPDPFLVKGLPEPLHLIDSGVPLRHPEVRLLLHEKTPDNAWVVVLRFWQGFPTLRQYT